MRNGIEELNRQDAKITERKKRRKREYFQAIFLLFLSVFSLRTWRLGGSIPGPFVGRNPPPRNSS
jgi:cell division protein FtsB